MRFYLSLPVISAPSRAASADTIGTIAAAAERAGFEGACVTDHPFPSDEWLRSSDGHHALDPFVALSFAAAATSAVRLVTYLCVLPYRNPFLVAKAALTLHLLSGERLVLGTGAGYLEAEFRALGVDFEARNDLFDEGLVAMRRAWSEDSIRMRGRNFEALGHTMRPRPPSHPIVWVGGNSKRAIRRAVDLGEGWIPMWHGRRVTNERRSPFIETVADLRERLEYAQAYRVQRGWSGDFSVTTMPFVAATPSARSYDPARLLAHVAELVDIGVHGLVVPATGDDLDRVVGDIDRFASDVIGPAGASLR